jgi:hypothetical protein
MLDETDRQSLISEQVALNEIKLESGNFWAKYIPYFTAKIWNFRTF